MQRRKPDIASTCQVSGVWVYRNLQVNVIGKWNITTLTGRIQNRGRARAFLFPKKKNWFLPTATNERAPFFSFSFTCAPFSKALPRKGGRRENRGSARHLVAHFKPFSCVYPHSPVFSMQQQLDWWVCFFAPFFCLSSCHVERKLICDEFGSRRNVA